MLATMAAMLVSTVLAALRLHVLATIFASLTVPAALLVFMVAAETAFAHTATGAACAAEAAAARQVMTPRCRCGACGASRDVGAAIDKLQMHAAQQDADAIDADARAYMYTWLRRAVAACELILAASKRAVPRSLRRRVHPLLVNEAAGSDSPPISARAPVLVSARRNAPVPPVPVPAAAPLARRPPAEDPESTSIDVI